MTDTLYVGQRNTARGWPIEPPITGELRQLFETLNDHPLITLLIGPPRRGPKGHPVPVLWRCTIAKYALGIDSTAGLLRELRNNPFVAAAVGIFGPDNIPHESTFSRFFARIAHYQMLPRLKDVSRDLVRRRYAIGDSGFGERVALDSSTLKAWSNGARSKKADPQAGWCVKMGSQGVKEYTYGWKLHLLVDCETEFPLSANVSPGNVHDSQRATNLLREARVAYSKFLPKFVMADKGYSGFPLQRTIRQHFFATPVIEANPGHKRLKKRQHDLEASKDWKSLYAQRVAVERVFSRLKGARSLNNITVRGRWKVAAHCYLALITMQATQVAHSAELEVEQLALAV